ncbi:hypothetical protein FISHEDRAFT_73881 [Fistulina hepatica ATCC 64428]|uniref:Uncharacterized protein n=1 Tax=Fistulina hepatica ATCC 64428 TaxID=1128425 RepID=A0A0D7AEM6_9AGAR|nr:hypothetical protein FISHEDRAFT_73881 [Fistulina hepatica ATCC 64428]
MPESVVLPSILFHARSSQIPSTLGPPRIQSYCSSSSSSSASSTSDASTSATSNVSDLAPPLTTSQSRVLVGMLQTGHSNSFPHRKIRFAPLPDPRRAVLVTGDGDELPLDDVGMEHLVNHDAFDFPSVSSSNDTFLSAADHLRLSSSCPPSPYMGRRNKSKSQPIAKSIRSAFSFAAGSPMPSRPSSPVPSDPEELSSTPTASLRLQSPSESPVMVESNLSLSRPESLNSLSRTSSCTSVATDSTPTPLRASSGWGSTLRRWASSKSNTSKTSLQSSSSTVGSPLARITSTQSDTSPNKKTPAKKKNPAPRRPSAGIRMLNGRVYGRRSNPVATQNLFASAREETAFVEWGYGGMGSVKSGGNDYWRKVQGSSSFGGAACPPGGTADDVDDGGGMAWVRKRREARERAKREQEEKERLEKEKTARQAQPHEQQPHTVEHLEPIPEVQLPASPSHSATITAATSPTPSNNYSEQQQQLQHVSTSVPSSVAPPLLSDAERHGIPVSNDSRNTDHREIMALTAVSPVSSAVPAPLIGSSEHEVRRVAIPAPAHVRRSSESSHVTDGNVRLSAATAPGRPGLRANRNISPPSTDESSESESDIELHDGDAEDEEEEEEEEDEQAQMRATSKGAGVEVISRHHGKP